MNLLNKSIFHILRSFCNNYLQQLLLYLQCVIHEQAMIHHVCKTIIGIILDCFRVTSHTDIFGIKGMKFQFVKKNNYIDNDLNNIHCLLDPLFNHLHNASCLQKHPLIHFANVCHCLKLVVHNARISICQMAFDATKIIFSARELQFQKWHIHTHNESKLIQAIFMMTQLSSIFEYYVIKIVKICSLFFLPLQ